MPSFASSRSKSGISLSVFIRVHPWLIPLSLVLPAFCQPASSQFQLKVDHGAIVSLKPSSSNSNLDFLPSGRRLGDLVIKYRHPGEDWQSFQTATPSPPTNAILSSNATEYSCQLSDGQPPTLALKTTFTFQPESILWSFSLSNL